MPLNALKDRPQLRSIYLSALTVVSLASVQGMCKAVQAHVVNACMSSWHHLIRVLVYRMQALYAIL